ncbi:GH-E family nuclease [Sphaerisporangium album]|uniref:GH-E family nuclease n=1 Tax=Sphaerisporangium album TaxID=509200 RepID=UPI003CCC8CB9
MNRISPNTLQPITGKFHYGHKPGSEYGRARDAAKAEGTMSREDFIKHQNDPEKYQTEDAYENMSHRHEQC